MNVHPLLCPLLCLQYRTVLHLPEFSSVPHFSSIRRTKLASPPKRPSSPATCSQLNIRTCPCNEAHRITSGACVVEVPRITFPSWSSVVFCQRSTFILTHNQIIRCEDVHLSLLSLSSKVRYLNWLWGLFAASEGPYQRNEFPVCKLYPDVLSQVGIVD